MMPNDAVRFAMTKACAAFGSKDTFNAACFSNAITKLAGVKGSLDGSVVAVILCGRIDVMAMPGDHYKLKGGI